MCICISEIPWMGAQSSEQVKASNYKKLPCLSVCLSTKSRIVRVGGDGPKGSRKVWKSLERVLKGLGRVLGGSLEGLGIQACLKKVGHPSTRWVPVLVKEPALRRS